MTDTCYNPNLLKKQNINPSLNPSLNINSSQNISQEKSRLLRMQSLNRHNPRKFNKNKYLLVLKNLREQNEKLTQENNILKNKNEEHKEQINIFNEQIFKTKTILNKLLDSKSNFIINDNDYDVDSQNEHLIPIQNDNHNSLYGDRHSLTNQLVTALKNISKEFSDDKNQSIPEIIFSLESLKTKFKNSDTKFKNSDTKFKNSDTKFKNSDTKFKNSDTKFKNSDNDSPLYQIIDDNLNILVDLDKLSIKLWKLLNDETDKKPLPKNILKRIDITKISELKSQNKNLEGKIKKINNKKINNEKLEAKCNELTEQVKFLENKIKNKVSLYIDAVSELLQCVDHEDKNKDKNKDKNINNKDQINIELN